MGIDKKALVSYKGKTVLVTGHTGFKGAWLCIWLKELGAKVVGFSLPRWENDRLFRTAQLSSRVLDKRGDIADFGRLKSIFSAYKPEFVFHLAAQPLVRESYLDPLGTIRTNIIGTANVLECVRSSRSVRAAVIITTDKCYRNKEQKKGYKETDELGGHDPYSMSKASAELVVESYRKSFFTGSRKLVASARAGNNLGGGDYSKDRLIPDCIRALKAKKIVCIRNPRSTRPWQHVLEPLYGYLLLGAKLGVGRGNFASAWNFGPGKSSVVTVSKVADLVMRNWGSGTWSDTHKKGEPHEAGLLSLDIGKARKYLGWRPRWGIEKTVKMTIDWYKDAGERDAYSLCQNQIEEYING